MKRALLAPIPIAIVAILLVSGLLAALLIPAITGSNCPSSWNQARSDIRLLIDAARFYPIEYGGLPEGDSNEILKKLQESNNPHNLVLLKLDPKRVSREGLYLDPWGTPYAFDLSKGSDSWAYSFGRNKLDEGGNGDDVASWNQE